MSSSKDKGRRAENLIVEELNSFNIPSQRVPLSGSLGGQYSDDVIIGTIDNPLARLEVKNRESIGDYIWDWLGQSANTDFLIMKKNRKKMLVVMDVEHFAELWKIKNPPV